MGRTATAFYAVARGRRTGVFSSWAECESQVKGFSGASFKKFSTLQEAKDFAAGVTCSSNQQPSSSTGSSIKGPSHSTKRCLEGDDTTGPQPSKATRREEPKPDEKGRAESERLRRDGFVVDEDGTVQVFTDGACFNNGKGTKNVRAGMGVWWNHHHRLNVSSPLPQGMRRTNNVAEIQAAVEAIKIAQARGIRSLCVNTDSQFLINCITSWIASWKRNGWKTSKGEAVINKSELMVLDALIADGGGDSGFRVRWNHVRGHVGIEGNEAADGLANAGAAQDTRQ